MANTSGTDQEARGTEAKNAHVEIAARHADGLAISSHSPPHLNPSTHMEPINRRTALKLAATGVGALAFKLDASLAQNASQPFGAEYPELDSLATGEWWTKGNAAPGKNKGKSQPPLPPLDVPRDQVVAFALYTVHGGVMKMTAQLFPLKPGEPREARLEAQREGVWIEIA